MRKKLICLTLVVLVLSSWCLSIVAAESRGWYSEDKNMFVSAGQTKTKYYTYSSASSTYAANDYVDPPGSSYSFSDSWNLSTHKLKVKVTNNHEDTIQVFWTNYYYVN
jgi:hypothetical protein